MITRKERLPHGFLSFSASVLGANGYTNYTTTSTSVDDIRQAGLVYGNVDATHNGAPASGMLISLGWGVQIIVTFDDNPKIYVRNHNGQRWVNWGELRGTALV